VRNKKITENKTKKKQQRNHQMKTKIKAGCFLMFFSLYYFIFTEKKNKKRKNPITKNFGTCSHVKKRIF